MICLIDMTLEELQTLVRLNKTGRMLLDFSTGSNFQTFFSNEFSLQQRCSGFAKTGVNNKFQLSIFKKIFHMCSLLQQIMYGMQTIKITFPFVVFLFKTGGLKLVFFGLLFMIL